MPNNTKRVERDGEGPLTKDQRSGEEDHVMGGDSIIDNKKPINFKIITEWEGSPKIHTGQKGGGGKKTVVLSKRDWGGGVGEKEKSKGGGPKRGLGKKMVLV